LTGQIDKGVSKSGRRPRIGAARDALRDFVQGPARMQAEFVKLREGYRLQASQIHALQEVVGPAMDAIKQGQAVDRARLEVGRLDYGGADVYLRLDSAVSVVRLTACAKEPWTVEWIECRIAPGEVLYDIGASVGPYALIAAKSPHAQARVIAFEPAFASFAALCENVVLNDAGAAITPLPITLGARTGMSSFGYSDLRAGAAVHALGESAGAGRRYSQPVTMYRLDQLRAEFELPQPQHIKLDVDGFEPEVLAGAEATLAHQDLKTLMVEVADDRAEAVVRMLASHGLRLAERYDRTKHGEPVDHWYGLFVRQTP
jgi:FkbM family methyltransferase